MRVSLTTRRAHSRCATHTRTCLTSATQQTYPAGMAEVDYLPDRVVVGRNGAYWRDYGDWYSMCPVSTDNDPVDVMAVYERKRAPEPDVANSAAAMPATCPACGFTRPGYLPDEEWARQMESCYRRRATPEAPEERTSSLSDEQAERLWRDIQRATTAPVEYTCDGCGKVRVGTEIKPPYGWLHVDLSGALERDIDLCASCALPVWAWTEPVRMISTAQAPTVKYGGIVPVDSPPRSWLDRVLRRG